MAGGHGVHNLDQRRLSTANPERRILPKSLITFMQIGICFKHFAKTKAVISTQSCFPLLQPQKIPTSRWNMFRRIADTLNFHSWRTDLFKINSACSCTIHHQSIGSSSSLSSFFVFRTESFRSSPRITRINSIWRRVKSFGKQTCNRHRFELILSSRREFFFPILGMKRNWCIEVNWELFLTQSG